MPTLTAPRGNNATVKDNGAKNTGPKHKGPNNKGEKPDASKAMTTSKVESASNAPWQIVMLGVADIGASPYQTRLVFDEQELEELAASVKAQGVQQPVLVRTSNSYSVNVVGTASGNHGAKGKPAEASPRYELIAGERRLRASRLAGRKTIPAIVRDDLGDAAAAELCLLENVQRSNLSPVEEARGYRRLMLEFRLKEERVAKKVGKSVATIRELMRLLQLPEAVQELLVQRQLTAAHGYELLRLSASPEVCLSVARHAALQSLTAASLSRDPLPNALELKKKGMVADIGWGTQFDWKNICPQCPFKAMVKSGYGSFCLKPKEWQSKQDAAIALRQDENARALEAARQMADGQSGEANGSNDGSTGGSWEDLAWLSQLPSGSYRNLMLSQAPSGCSESCPCRSVARAGEDGETLVPICLDPDRYGELLQQQREAKAQEDRIRYEARLDQALHRLRDKWDRGETASAVALVLLPFLNASVGGSGYLPDGMWEEMVVSVVQALEIDIPWDVWLEPDEEMDECDWLRQIEADLTPSDAITGELGAKVSTPIPLDPTRLLLLCAGVMLRLECGHASRFGGATPQLDFVLEDGDAQFEIELPDTELLDTELPDTELGEMELPEAPWRSPAQADDLNGPDTTDGGNEEAFHSESADGPSTNDPSSAITKAWSDPDFGNGAANCEEEAMQDEPEDYDESSAGTATCYDDMEADFPALPRPAAAAR